MELSFTKMQGCANDYIYLDCRTAGVPENIAALSEKLSRRHFSIGADGIICICAPRTAGADAMMRIFNADGSEGRMCGNGIRCVAEWLYTHGVQKEQLAIDTLSGLKTVTRRGEGLWQVGMGAYSTLPADLPAVNMGGAPLVDVPLEVDDNLWRVTCINVGNPHCVTVVPDVDALRLEEIGPAFEHHANFPERINTEFVQVVDATHLKMRVWERGSGETWACGTGTCATVAAMTELGICPAGEDVHVQLRGGELTIRVLPGNELRMTGAAETVCEGTTNEKDRIEGKHYENEQTLQRAEGQLPVCGHRPQGGSLPAGPPGKGDHPSGHRRCDPAAGQVRGQGHA